MSSERATKKRRHTAKCDCAERYERLTCAYCGTDLTPGGHEHDHFPIPASSGGTQTIPVCVSCHAFKDLVDVGRWPLAMVMEAVATSPPPARIMVARLIAELHHQERTYSAIIERLEDDLRAARGGVR